MAQTRSNPGAIKGQILVVDSSGNSYVAGAEVVLSGPVNLQTESDATGQYTFPSVVPGNYTIQATAPGLETQRSVTINLGDLVEFHVSNPLIFRSHVQSRRILATSSSLRAGGSVFNVFNHDNPRDVQNNLDSSRFGSFYNDAWREYRGKMVFEF